MQQEQTAALASDLIQWVATREKRRETELHPLLLSEGITRTRTFTIPHTHRHTWSLCHSSDNVQCGVDRKGGVYMCRTLTRSRYYEVRNSKLTTCFLYMYCGFPLYRANFIEEIREHFFFSLNKKNKKGVFSSFYFTSPRPHFALFYK